MCQPGGRRKERDDASWWQPSVVALVWGSSGWPENGFLKRTGDNWSKAVNLLKADLDLGEVWFDLWAWSRIVSSQGHQVS